MLTNKPSASISPVMLHCTGFTMLMLLLILFTPIAHAAIYKWVDSRGQVHYSGEPATNHASKQLELPPLVTTKPGISKQELDIKAEKQRKAEEKRKQQEALRPKPVKPEIPASEKRRLCQQARSDIAGIQSRGQMREINAKGDYVYLTEQQRQQRLSAAKKRQRKYCL